MLCLPINWLKTVSFIISCLAVQQPAIQPPALRETKAYVNKIDNDNTLLISRYSKTYGHIMKPGKDTIFWAYPSDHIHSAMLYYSVSKLVKVKEIIRFGSGFCENSYYLRNNKLLFVAERQASCTMMNQRAIWLKNATVCNSEKDTFFRGNYYYAHDSCVTKQEQGQIEYEPEGYYRDEENYKSRALSRFFPWQAARYVTAFGKIPAGTKQPPNFRP